MTCETCGEKPKKCGNCNNDFPRAVIEINNPETLVLLRKVVIPASMGTEEQVPPVIGKYHNVILYYEANSHVYLYSSDGIPTMCNSDSGEIVPVVQTIGSSTTDVMSQDAVTKMIFPLYSVHGNGVIGIGGASIADFGNTKIGIGKVVLGPQSAHSLAISSNDLAVGTVNTPAGMGIWAGEGGSVTGHSGIAIGNRATVSGKGGIAIGRGSSATSQGEFNIGSSNSGFGYNGTNYRLLTGVHDPVNAHDAATKEYVDDVNSYSTTETLTGGTWIDGSPIYKKTIDTGALPDNNSNLVSHGISDLKRILKVEGWAYNPTTTFTIASSNLQSGNDAFIISVPNKIGWQTTKDLTAYTESYVTLYYTKTQ